MGRRIDLVATPAGRKTVFAALYVSEGAPIGFLWWYLPPKLRLAGVDVATITAFTATLVLPWTFKFLWAPSIDVLRGPRWGHRHWILCMQLVMGLTLLPLAWLDLGANLGWVFGLLIAHALSAATQDVAIDAWAIGVTPEREHAGVSGWMQAGKYAGRWLFGAGLLLLGAAVGRETVLPALVIVVWASGAAVLLSRDVEGEPGGKDRLVAFVASLRAALGRRATWLGLLIAATAGAGFEGLGGVATVFLVDRGFGESQVGAFLTASVVMLLLGSVLGGMASDRIGHVRSVTIFLLLVAAAGGGVAAADAWGVGSAGRGATLALLVLVYLAAGMLIASSYGLFMDLTDPRLGGTQFSAFMGATNACESWSNFTIGRLIDPAAVGLGYGASFAVMSALSLLGLPFLAALRSDPR